MGYLIRHLIKDIEELFGLFLLPSKPSSIRGFEVLYANSYGALKDLEHFNSVESVYKEMLMVYQQNLLFHRMN